MALISAIFCAICGGPIRQPMEAGGLPWPREMQWQARVVLLWDPTQEFEMREEHYHGGKRKGVAPLEFRRRRLDTDREAGHDDGIRRVRAIYPVVGSDDHVGLSPRHFFLEQEPQEEEGRAGEGDNNASTNTSTNGDNRAQASGAFGRRAVAVNAHRGPGPDGQWSASSPPYYIAMHEECVDIAERVAARPRPGVNVRSLETLWKVLRTRFDARDNEAMAATGAPAPGLLEYAGGYVPLPNAYYMPPIFADERSLWGRGGSFRHWCMTDPGSSPGLTPAVLNYLRPTAERGPALTPAIVDFQNRFSALPRELRDHIVSFLRSRDPLPAPCTRLISQEHWRQILVDGCTLPFLWDLDADTVDYYRRYRTSDSEDAGNEGVTAFVPPTTPRVGEEVELDFEHLVRTLSQPAHATGNGHYGDTEPGPVPYEGLPDGLRNRRRIWQLVEEMFVGDVLPVARRRGWAAVMGAPTMPRYWHEDGRPAYPVIRILGLVEE